MIPTNASWPRTTLDRGSGISRGREAQLNADTANAIVGNLAWWYQANCPVWESDLGEEFRTNFTTELPTVIVHGTWDVSTPFENALELVPFFSNSRFVQVIGGSHGALGEAIDASDEFRNALWHYAKTRDSSRLPPEVRLPPIDWVIP